MLESMKEKKIAIVGIGCRFPGGSNSAEEFWRLLDSGTDAIRETPGDRWSSKAFYNRKRSFKGKTVSKWGGFIDNVDKFDAAFFGISNREAPYMDPQQRLLLETTWEAFEDGGLVVEKFSGTKVGVYIGGFTLDYKILQFGGFDYDSIDIHTASGSMMTNLSNRISHVFDFKGPSISIDTACSSSLVALHLASQGIKNGDCDAAVVGGVMLNLAPQYTIAESQGGFLSEDGRCKTLDAAANGYVRGEGVGIVILKKLEDAVRDNDYIYSVVEAAGANQDGHTSAITVPSADAQERLMREVHKRAGVKSSDIQYVEMHGTGTSVGDPIEAEALGKVFSEGRSAENPCFIGSVKTMIGHLESAAGVASIIKVSMSLDKKKIPRHLNMREINPKIDLETYKLKVPQKTIDWPDHKGEALACINGFGFGGTNGHIVLSGVSARRAFANGSLDGRMKVFAISARSQESLKMQAEKYIRFLDQNYFTGKSYDLARNMMLRRDQHNFRLAVAEKDAPGLMRALQSYIDGDDCSVVYTGKKKDRAEKGLVFVFTGMGAQYWNMGRGLYACEPVFKEEVDRIDVAFSRYSGWSLVEKMMSCREDDSEMAETCVSQPANFAIQVGIYKLLEAKGVAPEVIVGHSVGEVAAFYCSGIFTFEDAIKVIYYRSMLQHTLAGQGKMLAVSISKEQASGMLAEYPGVEIAAINSMNDLTLTGDETGLKGISEKLTDEGVFNRFLTVSVPFHSRHMEKIQDAFRVGISGIKFNTPKVRFFSTVLGVELEADSLLLGAAPGADNAVFGEAPAVDSAAPVAVCSAPGADSPEAGAALVADCQVFEATPGADSPEAGAALVADCQVFEATPGADCPVEYWWENIRNPVQFSPAVEKIIVEGYNAFIEVGPHPVLSYYIKSLGENSGTKISTVATMNRKQEDETCFYSALCRLFTENYFSDYEKLYPVESNFIKLPGYAWKHESFWMESAESRNHRLGVVDAHLLGRRLKAAKPTWELELSLEAFPFLEGHKIQGEQVFPAAGCIEAAFQAAKNYWGTEFVVMEDVEFTMLVFMKQDKSVRLHITLDEDNRSFEIFNMPDGIGQSDLVAKGRFRLAQNTGAWLQGGPQSRLQGGIQGRLQSRPQGGPQSRLQGEQQSRPPGGSHGGLQGGSHGGLQGGPANEQEPFDTEESTTYDNAGIYEKFLEMGYGYSGAFNSLYNVEVTKDCVTADLAPSREVLESESDYVIHPAVLDACLQPAIVLDLDRGDIKLPVSAGSISVYRKFEKRMRVCSKIISRSPVETLCNIGLYSLSGERIIDIKNFRMYDIGASKQKLPVQVMDSWLYKLDWIEAERPTDKTEAGRPADKTEAEHPADKTESEYPVDKSEADDGRWLILADSEGDADGESEAEAFAEYCRKRNRPVALIPFSKAGSFEALKENYDAVKAAGNFRRVISFGSQDLPQNDEIDVTAVRKSRDAAMSLVNIVKVIAQDEAKPKLWIVTKGGQEINGGSASVLQSHAWAIAKLIGNQEHVMLWGGIVDLDSACENRAGVLFAELLADDEEDMVAYSGEKRFVARATSINNLSAPFPVQADPNAWYVVTGAFGSLGQMACNSLVEIGARHLILMGRGELPAREQWNDESLPDRIKERVQFLKGLEDAGCVARVELFDMTDEVELTARVFAIRETGMDIKGVISTIGVVDDKLMTEMTKETFDKVYDAKAVTHWSLHKLFQDAEMDFFIMFSSVAALIAAPGQANYASANAFLDALSLYRRRIGLPSLSIAWGPWAAGMIKRLNLEQVYINKGIQPIAEKNGMQVMYRLIGQNIGYAAVVEADWDRVLSSSPKSKIPYLESLRKQRFTGVEAILSDSEKRKAFSEKFISANEKEQQRLVTDELKALISNSLRIKKDNLDTNVALVEMGMDSMLAIEISNRIDLLFGTSITFIDLFSANSIENLSVKIFDKLKVMPELQSEEELLASVTDEELIKLIEEMDDIAEGVLTPDDLSADDIAEGVLTPDDLSADDIAEGVLTPDDISLDDLSADDDSTEFENNRKYA